MNRNTPFLLFFALACFCQAAWAQQGDNYFSPNELATVYQETNQLLQDIEVKMKLIGNIKEDTEEKKNYFVPDFERSFYKADEGKTALYNDLDPTEKTSPTYTPQEYAHNLFLFYPSTGIETKLLTDSAKFGAIQYYTIGKYAIDIIVPKQLNGLYMDKTLNRRTVNLQFRIIFDRDGPVLKDFLIAGIRSANEMVKKSLTTDFYIGTDFWKNLSPHWKSLCQKATGFNGNPTPKNMLVLRQFISKSIDNNLLFSKNAFNLSQLISEVEPYKKKRKLPTYNGIVISETADQIMLETEQLRIEKLSKNYYRIKPRKSAEATKKIKTDIAKTELDSTIYSLILETGLIFPVTVSEKSADSSQIKVKVPSFGNKEIKYSIYEIKELILPVKRKGLYVAVNVAPAYSLINDKNLNMKGDSTWQKPTGQYGVFATGIHAEYFMNENIGIGLGLGYGNYKTRYNLIQGKQNQTTGNQLNYYGTTEKVNYQTISTISEKAYIERSFWEIEIPFYMTFILSSEAYKPGFFIRMGAKYSMITASNNGEGIYGQQGVLVNENGDQLYKNTFGSLVTLKNTFFKNNIDSVAKNNYNYKSAMFLFASLGWIKPLGKGKNFITVAPTFEYGFNINKGEYTDILGNLKEEAVSPLKISIDLRFNFKLSD
jgi:hypothetical protein